VLSRYEQDLDSFATFNLVHVATAPALFRLMTIESRFGARVLEGKVRAWALPLATRPSVTDTVPADFADRLAALMRERKSLLAQQ